jgi:hypothetical protein
MRFLYGLALALLVFGCRQQNAVYDKPYFDLDSLVNQQVQQLVNARATLRKVARVGDAKDERQWQPDSAQWAREFEVFRQLDWMNRPGFKDGYTIKTEPDTHSNLQVDVYTATRPSPVLWLKIYYLGHRSNIRKVEARYRESNALFVSERALVWELETLDRQPMLTHYRMEGYQKMIANDSVVYQIEGTIEE